ncbi:MAG: universal stress protein [Solirubrobacteraceae bacterium]
MEVRLLRIESASVGRGLHELAESAGADLLVVGSSARGLAGRVLPGDDTHAALNGAPCAVAIAPRGYASTERTLGRIGAAYNESAEAEHALSVARELAATHHATLSAMEVVSLPIDALPRRSCAVPRRIQ